MYTNYADSQNSPTVLDEYKTFFFHIFITDVDVVCFLELRPVATCTTLPSTAGILFKGKYWIIYFLTQETEGCDHTLSTKLYQHFCFFSKRWVDREWFKLILQPCLEFSIFLALFTLRIRLTLLIWTVCRICITYEYNNGLAHFRVLYSFS